MVIAKKNQHAAQNLYKGERGAMVGRAVVVTHFPHCATEAEGVLTVCRVWTHAMEMRAREKFDGFEMHRLKYVP